MFLVSAHCTDDPEDIRAILFKTKPTKEEIRKKWGAMFLMFRISISEIDEKTFKSIGEEWIDAEDHPSEQGMTTVFFGMGGDRFVRACVTDTEAKAAKLIGAANMEDGGTIRKVQIKNSLFEALKKGTAYLVSSEFEAPNDDAVDVDDEKCWWLTDKEVDEDVYNDFKIKLNKVLADV